MTVHESNHTIPPGQKPEKPKPASSVHSSDHTVPPEEERGKEKEEE